MTVTIHNTRTSHGKGLYFKGSRSEESKLCDEFNIPHFFDTQYNEFYIPWKWSEKFMVCATANRTLTVEQK